MAKRSIRGRAWRWLSDGNTLWGLVPEKVVQWVLAAAWPGAAMTFGLIGGSEVMWVMTAGIVGLAASFTALMRINEWHYAVRVQDKITFERALITVRSNDDGSIKDTYLGFTLCNSANFPINVKVIKMISQLGGRYPTSRPYNNRQFEVPPNGVGWFNDNEIPMTSEVIASALDGELNFIIKYGRGDRLKYVLRKHLKLNCKFNPEQRNVAVMSSEMPGKSQADDVDEN